MLESIMFVVQACINQPAVSKVKLQREALIAKKKKKKRASQTKCLHWKMHNLKKILIFGTAHEQDGQSWHTCHIQNEMNDRNKVFDVQHINDTDSIFNLPCFTSQTLLLCQCLQRYSALRRCHKSQKYLSCNYLRQMAISRNKGE